MPIQLRAVSLKFLFILAIVVSSNAEAIDVVVGPANCDGGGFSSAVAAVDASGSGKVTFNCGTATIGVSGSTPIVNSVVIDGAGAITFDANNQSGFFYVYSGANLTLKGVKMARGFGGPGDGDVFNNGTLTLDHVTMVNNTGGSSAPVFNAGSLDVLWSSFINNIKSSDGAAIANYGAHMTVANSTFSGNQAGGKGGAIFSNTRFVITNSTFNTNRATIGGAIYQQGIAQSQIDYATIVANSATSFTGGIAVDSASTATVAISRSILSANVNGNCSGALSSGGYNLWSGTSCPFSAVGDTTAGGALEPALLANNGGPTKTMLPDPGNTAIDHIPNAACQVSIDQRSGGRPFGAGCDSGAVEVGASLDLIFYNGFE